MNITEVNNQIQREKDCYKDMLTYARVYAECGNWEGAIRSLQDAQKSVASLRMLAKSKQEITEKFEKKRVVKRIVETTKRVFSR